MVQHFEDSNNFWGDRITAKNYLNIPSLIYVRGVEEGLTTEYTPNGDGRAVVLDVVNLTNGEISINVRWFTNALVDSLKRYAPSHPGGDVEPVAVKLVPQQGKNGVYPKVAALDGTELQYAITWEKNNPTTVNDARAKREAEEGVSAEAPAAPALPQLPATPPAPVAPPATAPPPAVSPPAANLDALLANVPEEQRAAVEAMLKQQGQ